MVYLSLAPLRENLLDCSSFSSQIQPCCSVRAWGAAVRAVNCPLYALQVQAGKKNELLFFFLCRKVHFSGIPLFLVFKWRLAIILLSLFLPPYSHSALLSFFLCYKLWGMRRESGKIKANPHTLPSNIIRLSLMALLEFLPCTCVWFCVHVQCYPCLFMHSHACFFLFQRVCVRAHLRLDVHVATTCSAFLWHEAQCFHWAAMPSALAYWARRPNSPSAKCMWELPTVWCHFCFVELFPKQFLTVQSYIVAERIKKQYNRKEKKKRSPKHLDHQE